MESIKKILEDKIIFKSSNIANFENCEKILKKIVVDYERDNLYVLKEETHSDEKIDMYLFWKNMLLNIIETKVITKKYSFEHYSCCFLDDNLFSIYLTYILYDGKLYDISLTNEF